MASLSLTDSLVLPSTPRHWLRSYVLIVRWELLSLRLMLPVMIVVQFCIGAGMVIGLGFLFEEIPRDQALYLSTGGPVIALLMVGLAMAPQIVAHHKAQKTYDFMLSLPVPRPVLPLAAMTVWMLIAVPGMAVALAAASWWYDLSLSVSLTLVPAVLLTVLVATSVGFAFAHAIPQPSVTHLITQALSFFILLYSPINYPAERLPGWLQTVHRFLPLEPAAIVIRGSLTEGMVQDVARSFLVLALWTVAAGAVTIAGLSRRK